MGDLLDPDPNRKFARKNADFKKFKCKIVYIKNNLKSH